MITLSCGTVMKVRHTIMMANAFYCAECTTTIFSDKVVHCQKCNDILVKEHYSKEHWAISLV